MKNRVHLFITIGLFCFVFVVGTILAPRAGVTWDEPDNIFAGGTYVTFFKEGFNPRAFEGFWDQPSHFRDRITTLDPRLSHYPPFPTYIGSFISIFLNSFGYGMTGSQVITMFHMATGFFFALLVATVFRFGLLLGLSIQTSVITSIITYLYPTLFGHGLTNLKDTAQVALFTLALYFLVRGRMIHGGITWGLGLATKFNLVYVPIIWVLTGRRALKKIVILGITGICIVFIVWPYLWFDPTHRGKEIFSYFTSVGQGYTIIWNGALYTIGKGVSYWWYPLGSLLYGIPSLLFIAIFLGFIALFRKTVYRKHRVLLLTWILVPLIRSFFPWSAYYDGIRHFMEILPPVIFIAGIGIDSLKLPPLLPLGLIAQLLFISVVYFPYSTGYYNMLARDPNIRYDRDIEGLSIKEGIDWMHKTYEHSTVFIPVAAHLSWYYLDNRDRLVYNPREADTVLLMNKMSHQIDTQYLDFQKEKDAFDVVHTIKRADAIFGWVYRRKPSLQAQ